MQNHDDGNASVSTRLISRRQINQMFFSHLIIDQLGFPEVRTRLFSLLCDELRTDTLRSLSRATALYFKF